MLKKTAYHQVGAANYKRKAITFVNTPLELKQKQKVHSKISEQIKNPLYNWIMHHPQVVQSPISNDCLKVKYMVTLNRNLFQNCYCMCLPDKCITILLEPQKMVD